MKKSIIIVLVTLLVFVLTGCGTVNEDVSDDASNEVKSITQVADEYIVGVKSGSPNSYPDITYGDAFDYFFSSPTWTHFKGSKSDDETTFDVVEFTGGCLYEDTDVKALIQFTISDDGTTFEPTYLSFNDVPQSEFMLVSLISKAFDDYQEYISLESNKASPSN